MIAPRKGRGPRRAPPKTKRAPVVDLAKETRIRAKLGELRALLDGGAVDPERTRAMLAGELEAPGMNDTDPDVATSIRIPRALLDLADTLAERRAERLGERASRSAVLRLALERGIAVIERETAALDSVNTKAAIMVELAALNERIRVWSDEGDRK